MGWEPHTTETRTSNLLWRGCASVCVLIAEGARKRHLWHSTVIISRYPMILPVERSRSRLSNSTFVTGWTWNELEEQLAHSRSDLYHHIQETTGAYKNSNAEMTCFPRDRIKCWHWFDFICSECNRSLVCTAARKVHVGDGPVGMHTRVVGGLTHWSSRIRLQTVKGMKMKL